MRRTRPVVLAILVMSLILCGYHASAQGMPLYLGEACFTLRPAVGGERTLQLGVLFFGAGHFAVHGGFVDPQSQKPLDYDPPAYGTAVSKRDGSISVSLTSVTGATDSLFTIEFDLISGVYVSGLYTEVLRGIPVGCPPICDLTPMENFSGTAAVRDCP